MQGGHTGRVDFGWGMVFRGQSELAGFAGAAKMSTRNPGAVGMSIITTPADGWWGVRDGSEQTLGRYVWYDRTCPAL